jgi:hypothetical protein
MKDAQKREGEGEGERVRERERERERESERERERERTSTTAQHQHDDDDDRRECHDAVHSLCEPSLRSRVLGGCLLLLLTLGEGGSDTAPTARRGHAEHRTLHAVGDGKRRPQTLARRLPALDMQLRGGERESALSDIDTDPASMAGAGAERRE